MAGPAEFAFGVVGEFVFEELFPGGAARVAEADPDEVEEFVGEDAGALGGLAAKAGVEMDFAVANIRARDGRARAIAKCGVPDEANGLTVRWGEDRRQGRPCRVRH